jgi:FMN-dependent oxidoreductase (nitrilotriacetate monooxygenase family)
MAQIHFNLVAQCGPSNMVQSGWTQPDDGHAAGLFSPKYWCDVARTLERGRFDGIFFADTLSTNTQDVEDVADGGLPRADPLMLVMLMSQVTKHLGFGATLTTVGTPPFLAVRRLGTVDNLTGGRLAWNVVTSYLENDFKALGLERPEHDLRYDQAEEYMEIAYRLWDAFPADAVINDKASKRTVDAAKLKPVRFAGQYYSCDTLPVMPCSPQGRPLIFQAGASGRGMRFAAAHADAVFALQPQVAMQTYVANTRSAADAIGRPHPRVFFGVQPYVASTEAEAERRVEELKSHISLDLALVRLGAILGRDFSKDDPDKPMEISETQASQGWMAAVANWTKARNPTLAEMALDLAVSPMSPRLVGTPEQVADTLEEWWRRTGCYGFMFSPAVMPTSLEDFVDYVVPILQNRGLMRREYAGTTYRENLLQQEY